MFINSDNQVSKGSKIYQYYNQYQYTLINQGKNVQNVFFAHQT